MAAYVNVRKSYTGTGAQDAIPLNRWGEDDYSVKLALTGVCDVTIQGTLDYVNRPLDADFQDGVTPEWFDITGLVNVIANTVEVVSSTPLEAIRANITTNGGAVALHVMQQGSDY
jgi:hypothetical protein